MLIDTKPKVARLAVDSRAAASVPRTEAAGAESQEVPEQEQAEVPEGGEDAPSTQGPPPPAEVVVERFATKVKTGVRIAEGPPERGREVAAGGRAKSNQFHGGKRRTRVRAAHRSIFTGQGSILPAGGGGIRTFA